MNKLVTLIAIGSLTCAIYAQNAFETLVTVKGTHVNFTQTITKSVYTIHDFLRIKGADADIRGFLGTSIEEQPLLAAGGVAAIYVPNGIGKGVDPAFGAFLKFQQQSTPQVGFYFGIRIRS